MDDSTENQGGHVLSAAKADDVSESSMSGCAQKSKLSGLFGVLEPGDT